MNNVHTKIRATCHVCERSWFQNTGDWKWKRGSGDHGPSFRGSLTQPRIDTKVSGEAVRHLLSDCWLNTCQQCPLCQWSYRSSSWVPETWTLTEAGGEAARLTTWTRQRTHETQQTPQSLKEGGGVFRFRTARYTHLFFFNIMKKCYLV